jgi:hypothetical protein
MTQYNYDNEVTPQPAYTGILTCSEFDWTANEAKEPFYYKDNSNLGTWVQYSEPFYIDFSDPRILSLGFGDNSDSSGILFMIEPNQTIATSGGALAGSAVIFTVPANSIVFTNTSGFLCGDATPYRNASDQKTFNMTGATAAVIPAGLPTNNGTMSVATIFGSGWYVANFGNGIPISILQSRGFLTSNNIFTAKFAFVVSGTGHCYVRDCTCSANCIL